MEIIYVINRFRGCSFMITKYFSYSAFQIPEGGLKKLFFIHSFYNNTIGIDKFLYKHLKTVLGVKSQLDTIL
jgi:hypothetical protein